MGRGVGPADGELPGRWRPAGQFRAFRVSGTVSELVWNEEVAEIYLGPILTQRMRQRFASPELEIG